MSIRAKMDGGKQINRIQLGLFEHRCIVAGLSMILGPGWIETTLKYLFGSCSPVTETFCGGNMNMMLRGKAMMLM